jgi:hypothetical protein
MILCVRKVDESNNNNNTVGLKLAPVWKEKNLMNTKEPLLLLNIETISTT